MLYHLIAICLKKSARGWFEIAEHRSCSYYRKRLLSSAEVADHWFLKSGSFRHSCPRTCLLNNTFQRMCAQKIFFSSLRPHSRILKMSLKGLPARIHASKLDIILVMFCKFCFYSNTYNIELRKLYFCLSSELGSCGISRKLTAADFMLRNSAEWPAWKNGVCAVWMHELQSSHLLSPHVTLEFW